MTKNNNSIHKKQEEKFCPTINDMCKGEMCTSYYECTKKWDKEQEQQIYDEAYQKGYVEAKLNKKYSDICLVISILVLTPTIYFLLQYNISAAVSIVILTIMSVAIFMVIVTAKRNEQKRLK